MQTHPKLSLIEHFKDLADPRIDRTKDHDLIDVLIIAVCIVTVDAMGCQKKIAKEIIEADANYVLALKGNQEKVHEEVKSFLDTSLEQQKQQRPKGALVPKEAAALKSCETVEKDHGRIETRRYYQSDYLDWFADKEQMGRPAFGGDG